MNKNLYNERMKNNKFFRNAVIMAIFFLPLLMNSCKYDLVDEPSLDFNERKNAADYKDFILPPAKVVASHGESKAVNLSWDVVENAVQYQVFAAESPYGTFTKVSETKGTETEITVDEESGITKYYCVSAVNYYGTVSYKSMVAIGSTLAVPVITEITASDEGNAVSLSWWMDNCSAETYADDVLYNIYVYTASSSNIKSQSLTTDGYTQHLEISGLTSKTEYKFEVEVVNSKTGDKEISEKTTAETAHRVIPDAPQNFTVAQGESTDEIELKWTLPEGAWYRESAGLSGFVLHPVYFNIYRKESNQNDDKYELITTAYVKSNNNWKYRKALPAVKEGEVNKNIEIEVTSSDKALEAPYETYVPEAEVSWIDVMAERGKKYTYYIQTVTDDTPNGKIITSDSSKTEPVEGWKISEPVFSIISVYDKDENDETVFTKITFTYNLAFETFGKNYTYFVERKWTQLPESTVVVGDIEEKFYSISELKKSDKNKFTDPAKAEGYYTFTLYVASEGCDDKTAAFEKCTVQASGQYLVTDKANLVPKIDIFEVEDGYSNHFKLSWSYVSDYKYTIHWKEGETGLEKSQELQESDISVNGDTATYNHPANSGDRRIYTLEASQGLLSRKTFSDSEQNPIVCETLGTAQPKVTEYDYDRICIEWPTVQKSDGIYSVSAKDSTGKELVTQSNIQINEPTEENPNYTCVIDKPAGYDDASKSGNAIKLTVTTQNTETNDKTTCSNFDVCTVGPAKTNVNVAADQKNSDRIVVQWNPATGAKGYIIKRVAYRISDTQDPTKVSSDVMGINSYYCDAETLALETVNGAVSDDVAKVSLVKDGESYKYVLTDINKEIDEPGSDQNRISWGIPFGYTVIPVKATADGSADDFEFDGRKVKIRGETEFRNIKETFGATLGYGLKLHAKKSESTDKQELEWEVPYKTPATRKPSIYYKEAGTNNSWKKKSLTSISDVSNGLQSASFIPENLFTAYEYFVTYNEDSDFAASFKDDSELGLSINEDSYTYSADVPAEYANKGYLLAVDYSAGTGSNNSEIAYWDKWNYNKRSIGPTKAFVRIKNYNLSSEWIPIAELDEDLKFVKTTEPENTKVETYDGPYSLKATPVRLMAGTKANPVTAGPLMVLRDAKHYYSIELSRDNKSYELINDAVYAYREITSKELVKCALLNMAYGFYINGGGDEGLSNAGKSLEYKENNNPVINGSGSYSFGGRSLISALIWDAEVGKYKADVSMTDYAPYQLMPSGEKACVVKISMNNISTRTKGLSNMYLDKFRSEDFTLSVTKTDPKMPDSYSATFTMSCTGSSNLLIKNGSDTIVNTSSSDERKCYFPIQMDDSRYWLNDPTYGWWPKSN